MGYYQWFIQDFATIAYELNKLTSKTLPFVWGTKQQEAFDKLKIALTMTPVLWRPQFDKDWILEVDASDIALGAVLSQEQDDGDVHPIYYWSKQLSKAEQNYSVMDRECLAVV